MAGIGIKANISLNKKQLSLDIAGIQKQIADTGSVFKLSIDGGTIAQLGELKTQLKEIIDLAGKGISIKIDTTVVQKAKKEADELKQAMAERVTSGQYGSYDSSLGKANKLRHEYLAKSNEEVKTTMQFVNELGQAYTEVWRLNEKSGGFELKTMNNVEDFGKIQKEVDGIGQSFEKVQLKYNQTVGAWGDSAIDTSIAKSITEVGTQFQNIKNLGNLTNAEDVERMKQLVATSQTLMTQKITEQELTDKIAVAQQKIANSMAQFKGTNAGRFVSQEDIDRIEQMRIALANVKNPAELKSGLVKISNELDAVKNKARESANGFKDLGNESHGLKKLSDGLAKIGFYFSAWRITSEVFQELKRGIGIVAELDNQIVQVGIDMNITARQSKNLVQQAQAIASETGIAIEEVIKVAGVYSNATETMESVMAKVKPSAILAGVSGLDASVATDMFQGIIAQYKLAGDDIEAISYDISDSVIAVAKNLSKNFDTSVKDISEALLDAGSVMEMMGYTYKETMAIVGATMEVTRESGSETGGAFKMIGARIGGAKNIGEDVAPEEISNAAKAYHKLGIEIVDANGKFKPMKDTLAELRVQWDTLSDAEKSNVAEMSAGNRRRNTFIAMMESMDKSTALTTIALNAQGETLKTNEKYLESSGAKMQNFKNAVDTLWQNTLSSELLKDVVDLGTALVKLTDKAGGIPIIIGTITTAILVHNKALDVTKWAYSILGTEATKSASGLLTVKTASDVASVSLNKSAVSVGLLKAALSFGLSVAITAAIAGLKWLIDTLIQTDEELDEISKGLTAEGNTALDNASKLRALVAEQGRLESSLNAGQITTEEATQAKSRLNDIYREIAEIAPEVTTGYDNESNALATNTTKTLAAADAQEELYRIKAKQWLLENDIGDNYAKNSKSELDRINAELADAEKRLGLGIDKTNKMGHKWGNYEDKKMEIETEERINELKAESLALQKDMNEVMQKELAASDSDAEKLAIKQKYYGDTVALANQLESETNAVTDASEKSALAIKRIDDGLSSSVDKSKKLGDMLEEIGDKDFKAMSSDSAEWMLENAPQLIQYLGDEKKLKEEILKLQEQERITGQQLYAEKMLHLSNEALSYYNMVNSKTVNDETFYTNTVKNNKSLVDAFRVNYGIDLSNYNSLAAAKNAVDIKYGKTASANYNRVFDAIYAKYGNMLTQMTGNERMDGLSAEDRRRINQLDNLNSKTANKTLNAISFTPVGYSGVTMSTSGGKSGSGSSGSGSSGDDQSYESDVADMNWYTHMVEDYQKKLEKLAASISKTKTEIENLKEVGSVKSLEQAIQKEKELYKLNEQKVALLKEERQALASNMNTLQKTINSKYGKIDMSTRTDESLDYYLDSLFPKIVSSNQAVVDARNAQREQFSQMFTDYIMLSNEYMSVDAEYIAMQSELMAITKERYDLEFALMDKQLEKRKKAIGEYANQYALLDDSSSFNEKESLMAQQLDGLKGYRIELEGIVSGLTRQLTLLDSNSQEWGIVNTQLDTYKDALQGTNVEILSMQQGLKSLRMEEYNASVSVIDKIVGTLREEYETAKKAELKALKDTIDAEMNIKNAELKVLQDRLDALNDTTSDKEAELRGLRQEQAMWEKDDSIAAKAKLAELELLIKDKEKELLKDSIQSEMDGIQTEIDDLGKFNEEQTTNVEDKYAKLLEEQALYQQATLLFQSQSQDEILALLLTYDEKYKGMGSVLGKAFAEGLMEEIANGIDGFGSLSDGLTGKGSIPWMENLSGSYNYAKSTAPVTSDVYANSSLNYKKLIDALGGVDGIATSGILSSLGVSSKSLTTSIANATISMPVTFYTNGQVDIDRSIGSLEKALKDALSGSGVALSLSVNR